MSLALSSGTAIASIHLRKNIICYLGLAKLACHEDTIDNSVAAALQILRISEGVQELPCKLGIIRRIDH